METLLTIVGIALVPFVISVVYGCTSCGSKKVWWPMDILALLVAIGVFFGVFFLLKSGFGEALGTAGFLAAALVGYLAVTIALLITYKVLYSAKSPPSSSAA
jgi:protein-S-isoprenylcysteine O-methyltransferase Ste14